MLTERTYVVADRGARPLTRGWFHVAAALGSAVAGAVLLTVSWMTLQWAQAASVTVYVAGLIQLFTVSAMYHRWPWRTHETVQWWRRADHATIAVFIAATYTPICVILLAPPYSWWLLAVSWSGAVMGAVLNLVWINHPRWLDVAVYVGLGWIVVFLAPVLRNQAGAAVVWLLFAGGVAYTVGAVIYGFKWPGRNARVYGYHEHFHTLTIVAAALHMIAVWVVVLDAA
ncbi:hemeolysin-III related [Corynebacterium capitovis DSM 44611]|uniref:PAQR family membrane homeostasis protein TrhA n=1 Tax=Corynebacterium capitovis TaxID=131081 RepID=UPI0003632E49|nr:hemolysin III family protein [Corynebacterium capitovis]WKD57758.1 hemeolysin-III related [Corynebacterium capitovis DSM 44611]